MHFEVKTIACRLKRREEQASMQGFSENVFIAAKSVTNVLKVSRVQNSSAYQRKKKRNFLQNKSMTPIYCGLLVGQLQSAIYQKIKAIH